MTKVVYNDCYGGFGLSDQAVKAYLFEAGLDFTVERGTFGISTFYIDGKYFSYSNIERTDPNLVKVVEALGEAANSKFADLQITDIPEGSLYRIDDYDGLESVLTVDDYQWKTA